MEVDEEVTTLVARRAALKTRMLELRTASPDDHDGFLRVVDQLMAVCERIVDLVSGGSRPAESDESTDKAPPAKVGGSSGPGPGGAQ